MRRLIPLVILSIFVGGCSSANQDQIQWGSDKSTTMSFAAIHEFKMDIPKGTQRVRVWLPMPDQADPFQRISSWEVKSPHATREVEDNYGNHFLFLELDTPNAGLHEISTTFDIARSEVNADLNPDHTRQHTEAELNELSAYLKGSSQSIIDDSIVAMANSVVGDETNPIRVSRMIYDAVLDHVEYHVKDPNPDSEKVMKASGVGSSHFAYEQCTGNCTDIHSLYAAVSRAAKIPTRVVYGSFFKGPLNGEDKDQSYHCWVEFHAPEIGWIPLDVAVADVFTDDFVANEFSRPRAHLTVADGYKGQSSQLVDYYYGNLDARRVVWHRNRDLVMKNPTQAGAPLLWNPKGYAEADGVPISVERKLTYRATSLGTGKP